METCRACGESPNGQNRLSEQLRKYSDIYFNLTSIKLRPEEDSNRQRICEECHSKLLEYNRFRTVCLQVHYRLTKIKSEVHEIPDIVAVECLPNEAELKAEELNFSETELTVDDVLDRDLSEEDSSKEEDQSSESDSEDEKPIVVPKKKRVLPVHSCDRCNKKFRSETRFEAHRRTHDGLNPWLCKICGVAFIKAHTLSLHMRQKHSEVKPTFPCDFPGCVAVYAHKQNMQFHRLKHDPNFVKPPNIRPKKRACVHCGKMYSCHRALKKHTYIHTGKKPPRPPTDQLTCLTCNKIYASKESLGQHRLRAHNPDIDGSLPGVICDICGKTFTTNDGLNIHVKTVHLGLKPFNCTDCGMAFGRSDHLKRHMKGHARGTIPIK